MADIDIIKELYEIVERRRAEREEGSYTAYLFDQGLDKILKKLGEECSETIIAAKNLENTRCADTEAALLGEMGDLIYHLTVLMALSDIRPEALEALLRERMAHTGNLKPPRDANRNT
ncbi:MAG: phosphoribosyl-ATP diphosphatase [Clostridiales bacterium]|nr:phosphoribosyl-ATP diphosphatase [Clostridiales bacterium]